ncbi:uncharacterized protein N7459_006056 [Penicillium hispanicum]|uniref:uncharacterized protein n=1 Tax=Penicillium hispanicum TaxID=1080232 RepID=UPI002541BE82|nr:uncharacterized protein N7459_006056 [Penicillium hispanicum]KAJ5580071.1 hypothetical protein N7459_006056 [Penicillium hispanicum]
MGRWGWRLFESDRDLDFACSINDHLEINTDNWTHQLSHMIHQTDALAPAEARQYYRTQEYTTQLKTEIVPWVRDKLNTDNLGDALFAKARLKEASAKGKYMTIILGALMMRAGANIKPEDIQHLRDVAPQINCNETYTLPLFDQGFRSPGRAQFCAALDHYQPGVPRNFQEPSCFQCGKVGVDIGRTPQKCGGCKVAWYCDRQCQVLHRRVHRPSCIAPERREWANV